jgi:formylglycine-generating enzyme required for sulfatase activity
MEWVADWYNPDFYFGITQINPLGPLEGDAKSLRGGSWLTAMEDLEVTSRASRVASVAVAHIGFRCARTPE